MDKRALGERIREARKKHGWSREILAERAGIGLMYLGEIERGVKTPSMQMFIKLINTLGVSADYVLRYEAASGKPYVSDEIAKKIETLTPKQRKTVSDILDAYIINLEPEEPSE